MNNLMVEGKKSVEKLFRSFLKIKEKLKTDPVKVFHDAIDNVPSVRLGKEELVGNLKVPCGVRSDKKKPL
ncbi:MAG: hypothetical protein CM15mP109_10040 [Candidatus Dadabacteria bacterium]|nr:MAG: hypothetical protein CM15mP109_10040 [Candidatus Dadabacteria bacterium]